MRLLALLVALVIGTGISSGTSEISSHAGVSPTVGQDPCNITVIESSITYFKAWLEVSNSRLVHIKIDFRNLNESNVPEATKDTINPNKWVWTYDDSNGVSPYLQWNTDYGLLSFGLLNTETLFTDISLYMFASRPTDCPIVFGTRNTTSMIGKALAKMTKKLGSKYRYSYWCFLSEVPGIRDTLAYTMGQYLSYPVDTIGYNCCKMKYNYTKEEPITICMNHQIKRWVQVTIVPYIIGLFLFLASTLLFLHIGASFQVEYGHHNGGEYRSLAADNSEHIDWVFLDGTPPISISKLFKKLGGFEDRCSIMTSRLRRFVFVILSPAVIYFKLYIYSQYHFDMTMTMVNHSLPVGFLSLLAGPQKSKRSFLPLFGGPYCLCVVYFVLACIVFVVPKSLQEVLESGLGEGHSESSPLLFGLSYIEKYSMTTISVEYGFKKAFCTVISRLYMIWCPQFWKYSMNCQIKRGRSVIRNFGKCRSSVVTVTLSCIFVPFYVCFCITELLLCVPYYALPFLYMVIILSKGLMIQITKKCNLTQRSSVLVSAIQKVCLFLFATIFIIFAYGYFLVFTESFVFIAEMIVYCFIAVVIFPNVAFGYLFFFTMLLYYIVRLIRDFGELYLDLLSESVEACLRLEDNRSEASVVGNRLILFKSEISDIQEIICGNRKISIPNNAAQIAARNVEVSMPRLKLRNSQYGLQRELFDYLVEKNKPVYRQFLKMVLHLLLIVALILATFSISNRFVKVPTSEISEVMHVMFIVAVGALPHIIEVFLSSSNKVVQKEIQQRRLGEQITLFYALTGRFELHNEMEDSSSIQNS